MYSEAEDQMNGKQPVKHGELTQASVLTLIDKNATNGSRKIPPQSCFELSKT